jgi:hypothetical protein
MESQSPPVTEYTVPSVVSRVDAYGSNVIGNSSVLLVEVLSHRDIQLEYHRVDSLFVADVLANRLASKFLLALGGHQK